jgi:cyclophilin family peptidyl-prolyl cis-trans isomerase
MMASGSQFFISFTLVPETDTPLSIIGLVASGMDVVTRLTPGDVITSITITERPSVQ